MAKTRLTLKDLFGFIQDSKKAVTDARSEYKESVIELYRLEPPFKEFRPDTESSFQHDLEKLYEIIGHCLIIGDADVLYQAAIRPIIKNREILSASDKMHIYINALQKRFESSESNNEKLYYGILIREFKVIIGGTVASRLINIE